MKSEHSKGETKANDTLNYEAAMTEHETEQIMDYPGLGPYGADANNKIGQGNVVKKDSYWMLM